MNPVTARIRGAWSGLIGLLLIGSGLAERPPAGILEQLKSEDYPDRVEGEAKLKDWALAHEEEAQGYLMELAAVDGDPEVQNRSLRVLKALVLERLGRKRPGFVGIQMDENVVALQEGLGIRVLRVIPDMAAERAGLKVNDVVVELDGKGWGNENPLDDFKERVGGLVPGTKVQLKVLRGKEVQEFELELVSRPWSAPLPEVGQLRLQRVPAFGQMYLTEDQARDQVFKEWLGTQKLGSAAP